MNRTTIKQLQSMANSFGSLIGKSVKVYPNAVGNGWDVVMEDNILIVNLYGTITQCYKQLDVTVDTIRRAKQLSLL